MASKSSNLSPFMGLFIFENRNMSAGPDLVNREAGKLQSSHFWCKNFE
jgi:hypothetical protein